MSKLIIVLIMIALFIGVGVVYGHNRNVASQRAQAIVAADNAGIDQTAALQELRAYVVGHSGASVSITLTGAYNRAQAAATAAASASAANDQVYADAQRVCAGKSDSIVQARCNQDYVAKHLVNLPASAPIVAPNPNDYVYHFNSPIWVADLAGALWLGGFVASIWLLVELLRPRRGERYR